MDSEGWCHQEGELLLRLRERQNGRLLLGDAHRVLQYRESKVEKAVLGVLDKDRQISKPGRFFKMSSTK